MSKWGNEVMKIAMSNPDVTVLGELPTKEAKQKVVIPNADMSKNEAKFIQLWELAHGPPLEREYKFHPKRRFRFDFAHLPTKTAIEIEGHGHQRENRYHSDVEKYNEAAMLGWNLQRITRKQLNLIDIEELIRRIT